MDLLALADFNLVAAHDGFGRASRASGRPKATLSRRVAELEAALGVRLVERGARGLRLTEAGRSLHDRTGPLLGEIAEAGADVGAGADRPRGHLRVSAPQLLSDTRLGAVAAAFVARHPDVTVEIQAEDRMADPVADGFDLVIRINPRPDERLVGRCVMQDAQWLVAPPGWTRPQEHGDQPLPLRSVARTLLPHADLWHVHDGSARWRFRPEPVMRLSTLPMVRDAVQAGAGAALLPRSLTAGDVAAGRLARWGWLDAPPTEVWALHTARRLAPPKVSAFVAHLAQALSAENDVAGRPAMSTAP